jgi:outer membrane lipoprotein
MKKRSFPTFFFAVLLSILLAGCASPISPRVRQEAARNLAFKEVLANPGAYRGVVVIWGGVIMKTVGRPDQSDLYLSETPLAVSGRPKDREYSEGEFVARSSQILDPKEYVSGRKVTVAGEVVGQELGTYDGAPYAYPVIRVKELHLWEEVAPLRWEWWKIPYYSPYRFTPQQYQQQPSLH